MYAYWVCAARETPFSGLNFRSGACPFLHMMQFSTPEHHHFTFFCRSGDHHFHNFSMFKSFFATRGRLIAARTQFGQRPGVSGRPDASYTFTLVLGSGAPHFNARASAWSGAPYFSPCRRGTYLPKFGASTPPPPTGVYSPLKCGSACGIIHIFHRPKPKASWTLSSMVDKPELNWTEIKTKKLVISSSWVHYIIMHVSTNTWLLRYLLPFHVESSTHYFGCEVSFLLEIKLTPFWRFIKTPLKCIPCQNNTVLQLSLFWCQNVPHFGGVIETFLSASLVRTTLWRSLEGNWRRHHHHHHHHYSSVSPSVTFPLLYLPVLFEALGYFEDLMLWVLVLWFFFFFKFFFLSLFPVSLYQQLAAMHVYDFI